MTAVLRFTLALLVVAGLVLAWSVLQWLGEIAGPAEWAIR
jgi:hypothetical protein